MTIKTLIAEAAALGPWRLTPEGFIRTSKTRWCPIIAVARKRGWSFGRGEEGIAADRLGIRKGDAVIRIIRATDGDNLHDARTLLLRKQMLKAFGLKEIAR